MSFLHPEERRKCKKCGHIWHAEKYGRLDAQQPVLGIGLTKRSQDLARQTVHEKRLAASNKHRFCPSCGSSKVKTISKLGAVPGSARDTKSTKKNTKPTPQSLTPPPPPRPGKPSKSFTPPTTPQTPPQVLPGWYPDPLEISDQLRYWDGEKWTNSTAAVQPND